MKLVDLMKTHFAYAEDIRDVIVNGDIVTLHDRAAALSRPVVVEGLPIIWTEQLDALRLSASLYANFNGRRPATPPSDL